VIAAVLAFVGILAFVLIVRRIEPIDWRAPEARQWLRVLPPQG